jgi:hypothetical protein
MQINPYNIWYDYGLSSYNQTQVFAGNLLYDVPFHKNAWVSTGAPDSYTE